MEREIDSALEGSLWKAGPFRLTPSLRVGGGYDSNGFSSAEFPISDVRIVVAPGLRALAPVRKRALFEISEEVNFVYYDKLEELRDIFGVTQVGGAVGGNRVIAKASNVYRQEKTRPSSEFDIPTTQRTNVFDASFGMALGWRQELTFRYENRLVKLLDSGLGLDDVVVENRLDRTEHDYRVGLTRRMTAKSSAVFEGFYELLDFDNESLQRDAEALGVLGGFTFTPKTNVTGEALVGYKRIIPKESFQADYSGLIGSVDVGMDLGQRYRLGLLFSRDAIPSILENNWYFIENRFGGSFEIYLMPTFSVTPGVVVGQNDYPRPEDRVNEDGELVESEITDRFETYSLSLNFHVSPKWTLSVRGDYWRRDSNVRVFTKDRFLINFGVTSNF
jgi:hypothetical protein